MSHVDHPEIAAVEWCFGAGGNHLGLRRVLPGLRLVALSEIEAYAAINVAAKMETRTGGESNKPSYALEPAPNWTDCRTFPCELLRDRVALFIASYPCQGESHAGKRRGAKDPRWLWPAVRRGVEEMRPLRCFFENVEGHLSKGLRTVCRDLEALGYRVAVGIFSAEEVGANHRRKRVFIMADAEDCDGELFLRPWEPGFDHAESGGGGEAVADAGFTRWFESPEIPQGREPLPPVSREAVADAERPELWDEPRRSGGASGAGATEPGDALAELADPGLPNRKRRAAHENGINRERPSSRAGGAGGELADAERESRRAEQLEESREWGDAGPPHQPMPRAGREAVADAGGARLPIPKRGIVSRANRHDEGRPAPEFRLPPFPPGPDDLDRWREVLALDPSLEPALCRMADGLAHRVDRLRLTGNGVVPDTAALAWLTLDAELRAFMRTSDESKAA